MLEQESEEDLEAEARAEAKEMLRRQRISESLRIRKHYAHLKRVDHPQLGTIYETPTAYGEKAVFSVAAYEATWRASWPRSRRRERETNPTTDRHGDHPGRGVQTGDHGQRPAG